MTPDDAVEELAYARRRVATAIDRLDQPDEIEAVLATLDLLAGTTAMLNASRTRAVFDRGDGYVVKVPLTEEGFLANSREAHWTSTEVPVAPCHLEVASTGVYVLVMEEVVRFPLYDDDGLIDDLPDWTGYVDCQQVGWLVDGRLVAYDL